MIRDETDQAEDELGEPERDGLSRAVLPLAVAGVVVGGVVTAVLLATDPAFFLAVVPESMLRNPIPLAVLLVVGPAVVGVIVRAHGNRRTGNLFVVLACLLALPMGGIALAHHRNADRAEQPREAPPTCSSHPGPNQCSGG